MSTSISEALHQYAIESGEIPPEDGLDEIHQDDDAILEYAIEATYQKIDQGMAIIASMESLSTRYLADPSRESFESYERAVNDIFSVAGIKVPISVFVPSFEAADEDPNSVKYKARRFGSAVWGAIVKAYQYLRDFLKRLFTRTKEKSDEIDAKCDSAIEIIKKFKDKGITHVTSKKPMEELLGTHAWTTNVTVPEVFLAANKWSSLSVFRLERDVNNCIGRLDTATVSNLETMQKDFKTKWDLSSINDSSLWSASLTDLEEALEANKRINKKINDTFSPIGKKFDSLIAEVKELEANPDSHDSDTVKKKREELERHRAAIKLFKTLSYSGSLGWTVLGIITSAKTAQDKK